MKDNDDRFVDITLIIIVLTVIILKLTGVIKLSWLWLLSPIWGVFLIGCVGAVGITIICLIEQWYHDRKKK